MSTPKRATRTWAATAAMAAANAVLLLSGPTFAAETGTGKGQISLPSDIIAILEKSENSYAITSPTDLKDINPDKYAETIWPQGRALSLPRVTKTSDKRLSLTAWEVPNEVQALLAAADVPFQKKKFEEATAKYRELVDRFPDFYKAWLYYGDCLFSLGKYPEALEAYTKGVDLNPYDYQGHLFKGHALVKLNRHEEALREWVRTLALRPHQTTVVKLLSQYRGALGIDIDDTGFDPRALVRREGSVIKVYTPPEAPWLAWATCKAVWLGEPSYRQRKTGSKDYAWGSTEEWECLVNLYAARANETQDKKAEPDKQLDRIFHIGQDQMLNSFMLYEIVARVSPDSLLMTPDEERDKLEEYIRRYVVMKRTAPSSPALTRPKQPAL